MLENIICIRDVSAEGFPGGCYQPASSSIFSLTTERKRPQHNERGMRAEE